MTARGRHPAGDETRAPSHDMDDMGHMGHMGHGRHGFMMIACCIPMLIIAIVLVATGVVGFGFIVVALACTVMMAFMMGAMNHGGD
ncbi:MAG TPA: hypothetical protein VHB02_18580 [Acidimicrobiales bacterium]|nr:hypothetical protein [Acidimicrobiales bacterium]